MGPDIAVGLQGIEPETNILLILILSLFLFLGTAFAESSSMHFPALRALVTFSHINTSFLLYGIAGN